MVKKLHYGSNEMRLSENEDLAALRVSIAESLNGWVEVRDHLNKTHYLLVAPGIPIHISDDSTRRPDSGPRVVVM